MKLEVKYGLITGGGIALWVLGEFVLGLHTVRLDLGEYSGYLSIIVPIIVFYFALKEKKDKELNGMLSIKQALKSGFLISLVAGTVIALFFYVYPTFINPQWMQLGLEFERNKMIASGVPLEQVLAQIDDLQALYTVPVQMGAAFVGTILQGVIISLAMALVLRKKTS